MVVKTEDNNPNQVPKTGVHVALLQQFYMGNGYLTCKVWLQRTAGKKSINLTGRKRFQQCAVKCYL